MHIGPTTLADLKEISTDGRIYIEPDGDAVIDPSNRFPNFLLDTLGADGSPVGLEIVEGLVQLGTHAYLGETRTDMTRQSTDPVILTANSWTANQMIVQGARRPKQDDRLPEAQVRAVPAAFVGFSGVARQGAYGWVGRSRRTYTKPSEKVTFQVLPGQAIEWTFDDEPPEGARWRYLAINEPPNHRDLVVHALIPANKKRHIMWGPFDKQGKRAPSNNETMIGRGRDLRRKDIRIRRAPLDIQSGGYRFRAIQVSPFGMSLGSGRSRKREIPQERKNHAFYLKLHNPHPDTTHVMWVVEKDGINYLLTRTPRRTAEFPVGEWVKVYGYAADAKGNKGTWILEEFDLPTEDASGIPDPDDPPPAPTGHGFTVPPPRRYYGTYAPAYGEEQHNGVPASAPPGSVVTVQGKIPQVNFPNIANELMNAEFGQVAFSDPGAPGGPKYRQPVNWNFSPVGYEPADDEPGVLKMPTGLRTVEDGTPHAWSDWVRLNKDDVRVARGDFGVDERASGGARAYVEFLGPEGDPDVPDLSAGVLGSETVLASELLSAGATDFAVRIGPATDSNGNPTNVQKVYPEEAIAYRFRFTSFNTVVAGAAQRNLTVKAWNLAFHPFDAAPRKLDLPPEGSGEQADANPTPEKPYHPGNIAVITEPPNVTVPIQSQFSPVQRVDFEGGSLANNWTITGPSGGALAAITQGAAIHGDWGWNISNQTTGQGVAYARRAFPSTLLDGSNIALRERRRLRQIPSVTDRRGSLIGRLLSHDSKCSIGYYLNQSGVLTRLVVDRLGKSYEKQIVFGNATLDETDFEIVLQHGSTDNANITFLYGKNGAVRRSVDGMSGVKFNGKLWRIPEVGMLAERDGRARWNFDIDEIVVTESGDELVPRTASPINLPLRVIDRPPKTGLPILAEAASGGFDYTHASDLDAASLRSEWDFTTGFPGVETIVGRIAKQDGTDLARIIAGPGGQLVGRSRDLNGVLRSTTIRSGLQPGVHGAEIVIGGLGKPGGSLGGFYIDPTGQRQPQQYFEGIDWQAQLARRFIVTGANALRSSAHINGSEVPNERDENGTLKRQLYIFKHPLIEQERLGLRGLIGTLTPGEDITLAWWMRWSYAGVLPSRPFRYFAQNSDGEAIDLGSVVDSLGGAARSMTWRDCTLFVDGGSIPEGFTELWMEPGDFVQGEFVAQDPLFTKGHLTDQVARDEARKFKRHPEARLTVTVPLSLPVRSPFISRGLGHVKLSDLFAAPDTPFDEETGAALAEYDVRYRTSPQDPPIGYSGWYTDPALVPAGASADIEVTMRSLNGQDTPTLGYGQAGYRFTHRLSTLVREDGSPLPGGTFVNGLEDAIERSDYNSEPVQGHARHDATTEKINRIETPIEINFATAEAYTEFLEEAVERDWMIESRRLGVQYLVRPYTVPVPGGMVKVTDRRFEDVVGRIRRAAWGRVTVERLEVLEEGALA